jgi:hypothetical protein
MDQVALHLVPSFEPPDLSDDRTAFLVAKHDSIATLRPSHQR